jgi:hypothetical protein
MLGSRAGAIGLDAAATRARGLVFSAGLTRMPLILIGGLSTLSKEAIKLLGQGGWVERF